MECHSEFDPIPKINEPICGRRFARCEDIANAMRQQVTRITHGVVNTEAGGIQRLANRWQRMVIVAGTYIEGLYAQSYYSLTSKYIIIESNALLLYGERESMKIRIENCVVSIGSSQIETHETHCGKGVTGSRAFSLTCPLGSLGLELIATIFQPNTRSAARKKDEN
ncbi:uncharacterized protein TNCV_1759621 [Trichonephila clavipes]|nr:uncharacterized protein TNCV_1759621 [Trichonephila clavipes]